VPALITRNNNLKPQRVLVLVHESLVPPDNIAGLTMQQIDEFRTEFDVVQQLKQSGCEVRVLGLGDNLGELRSAISDWQPHITFNLLEEFQGIVSYDQHVVAFLELMRQPYTGCNPRGLMISRDKALSKQILMYHRIPTPRFAVVPKGRRFTLPRKLSFPLFVKSVAEDASVGISQASLVTDAARLKERIEFVHEQTNAAALVEEFVEGRELYVSVIGNERLQTYPVWELKFGSAAQASTGFATRKVKWDRKYQAKHGIGSRMATELPEGLAAQLGKLSKRIFKALYLTGYARLDFRLRPDGSVYVLEANANPNLARIEDFATSAAAAGDDYPTLMKQILRLGGNYRAAWRE